MSVCEFCIIVNCLVLLIKVNDNKNITFNGIEFITVNLKSLPMSITTYGNNTSTIIVTITTTTTTITITTTTTL